MTGFADLARLHAEATPEPWSTSNGKDVFTALGGDDGEGNLAADNDAWQLADCDPAAGSEWEISHHQASANANLIAAARNAIPEFLRIREETLALHSRCYPFIQSKAKTPACNVCWDEYGNRVLYPCPTVRIWNGERE